MTYLCRYRITSMHLIGWQNTRETDSRRPPPPLLRPDGGGNPWPCTCVHGPKNSSRHAMNSTTWSETSTITRHGDTSTRAAHWSRRVSAVCRRRARGHDSCSSIDGASCQSDCEGHRGRFHRWSRGHARPAELPTQDWNCQRHAHSHATLRRQAQPIDGV